MSRHPSRRRGSSLNAVHSAKLSTLYAWGPKLLSALEEVREGKLSFSSGSPIRVSKLDHPRGSLFILDGHHRAVEAMLAGRKTIPVLIDNDLPFIERTGGAHRNIVESKVSVTRFLGAV